MKKIELFMVTQAKDDTGASFEFQGAFSSERKALNACKNDLCYITRGIFVDEELPLETVQGGPVWYPHRQLKPDNWDFPL